MQYTPGSSRPPTLLDIPGAARLTFDGQVALEGVSPYRERRLDVTTLAGDGLEVEVPEDWQVASVSASVLFQHGALSAGFQRSPRGSSLIHLLADANLVAPEGIVRMQGGVLAHYRLSRGATAVSGYTLWQGPWSDVYTFDYATLDEAVAMVNLVAISDAESGATVAPPSGWSIDRDEAVFDCGELVIDVRERSADLVPPWHGTLGAGGELYRLDNHGVLLVSSSAVATLNHATNDPIRDTELADVTRGLYVDWIASPGHTYGRRVPV